MKFSKLLYGFLVLFFTMACSKDDLSPLNNSLDNPEGENSTAKILKNVSYGTDEAQAYDLYLPAYRSAATTKVLVLVHGGGWVQGDKSDMLAYIPLIQENHPDYAIVNLNYRLVRPNIRSAFPNQFLDLQQALKQLSENADDLGFKAEFGLIGASAGAHIALQYDYVYDVQDQVKMVCSIVGPTNLTDPYYTENPDFELAMQFLVDQSAYPGITNYAKAVSPAYQVSSKSSATILFYGDDDKLVPINNGIFLKEQLDDAGVINSFTIYEGGHGDWEKQANEDLQLQLGNFIETHLAIEN